MPPFVTVTVAMLVVLRMCSYNTARKELRAIADALGVTKVTAKQLADYWSVSLDDLAQALDRKKKVLHG
jgi:ABC-type hemin transport system substrate-binding protein